MAGLNKYNANYRDSGFCWKEFHDLIVHLMKIGSGMHAFSHYNGVIMSAMASQTTNLMIVYSTVYSRHKSKKTSKLRVTGLCEGNSPVNGEFPTQWPVTRKMFPFDDVIMCYRYKRNTRDVKIHNNMPLRVVRRRKIMLLHKPPIIDLVRYLTFKHYGDHDEVMI